MFEQLALTYSYSYSPTTTSSQHRFGVLFGYIIVTAVVVGLLEIIGLWKIFQKAGRPGWTAIIPIYNYWSLFEISGKPGWWSLFIFLSIIPFGGLVIAVFYILAMIGLAKRFGKSTLFTVLGLIIFSFVGFLILGFGQDKYQPAVDGDGPANPGNPPLPPNSGQ